MIKIITNKSKKLLAEHLAEHDKETLEFFTEVGKVFGPFQEIGYEGPSEHILRERLVEIRRQQIQDTKEILK